MGCSAAKNITVEPRNLNESCSNGAANKNSGTDQPQSGTIPNVDLHPGEVDNALVNNVQKAGNGLSFDITFDENEDKNESIIQKHPPKRILELQESENRSPVTLEKLQEKLEEAEIRRQQILQQRIQSANLLKRLKNNEMLSSAGCENNDDQSPHHLKVPTQSPSHPSNPCEVTST